jgi:hypothetical protein
MSESSRAAEAQKWIALFFLVVAVGCFWSAYLVWHTPNPVLSVIGVVFLAFVGFCVLFLSWISATNGAQGG